MHRYFLIITLSELKHKLLVDLRFRVHLKISQYKCDLCEDLFKVLDDLKKHYKNAHETSYKAGGEAGEEEEDYRDLETDLPGVDDLSTLTLQEPINTHFGEGGELRFYGKDITKVSVISI